MKLLLNSSNNSNPSYTPLVSKMKQSTLFSVFTKNTTLNGTSNQLDHPECNNVKVERNADKPKNTSKHSAQAESSLDLDVSPNTNVRNTKVNKVSLLDVELDNEDKTTKGEVINCKQGKLSLSCVRKSNAEVSNDNKSESKSDTNNQIEITRKSVTVQTTQLNVQSRIKESQQNTSVEHSNTQLSSGAVEKKGVSSIDYATFLTQLAHKNEKEIQQNNEVSTLCTENETKQNMSYSEFLGMFKSPPKVEESTVTIDKDEPEKCPPPLPFTEQQKEVKCKSIASFFTKIESKPQKINSPDVAIVTVIAEVHSMSSLVKHKKSIETTHAIKLPGKMDKDDKCEIEFLSSETISDVEVDARKKVQGIKRNSEAVSLLLQVSKKQKVEQESELHKQTVETKVKKYKNETQSDVSIKALKEIQTTSKKNSCLHGADETSTETSNVAKIEPGTHATTSAKSSQATLHFGTSGLSLKKAAAMKIDTDTEEDTGSTAKILGEKTIEKQPSRKNKVGSEEEDEPNICKDSGIDECERETESEEKNTNFCKREDTSMDCKEPAASREELSQATTNKNMEIVEDTAQVKTEEIGTRRRSARLAQSFHASKDVDVVEITSDDEEDVDLHEPKKRLRRGTVTKSSTTSGSPGRDWQVKTKGKLAPIFTCVKSKELVGKILPVLIDPEQERLRREFMMSGIPDELKRHIATTASNTNLMLDYPPLPTISHVQQIPEVDCLSVEVKIPKLRILDDSFQSSVGMWESLGWKKTQSPDELHRDPFKMFTSNPSVQGPHVDLLLQELQCCDGKFPFQRTHGYLHRKIVSSEIASTETAGNKPVVIDVETIDDDVIVCDASHISDLHPVKNTLESKASLWSDLHQPESTEHIIGNTRAMKQLKEWLEEWKVVLQKQVRKASKISKNTNKNKNKGGWSDDSDFTDSEEEETLCNSVLITGGHGIGKTASVYALAKELGYKVFEVNSSSLRSGKQLLAQLEEATQSHRVAQNKNKSAGLSDTPPAGSSKNLDIVKSFNSVPKPKLGTSAAFANLFRLTPQAEDSKNKASQSKNKGSKLTLSSKESKSGSTKKNIETPSHKIIESVPARSQRKKKNEALVEIGATKLKNRKNEDKKVVVAVKSQIIGECGLTSGSLNLTSASLILFDEVDVVFEEDKGFLATVQHFMMSTKIPIVLTSTDAAFHLQLQARHDHIRLSQPPLLSAASFLSTLCLAHGVRISHHSVLNALRYTKGDIRRCLLNLQYWCESGGGVIQITRNVDPNSLKNIDIVDTKIMTGNLAKTFRSRMVSTDDSNDSDFISLRPPKKKAKQMTSDEDSSMDTFTAVENSSMVNSPQSKKIVSLKRKDNKLRSIPIRNQVNVILEEASGTESCQLPLVHIGFEESLLGLHGYDMSLPALIDLIKASALSCQALDHAVNTFSVIAQALNNDVIYHVALHSLPLPKVGLTTVAQLTIPAPLEAVASEMISSKKPRKRIIQGDWMDSDSSDAESRVVKNVPLDCPNVEHSQENSLSKIDSGLKDELSVSSIPEKELAERKKVTNGINNTETESKPSSNSLTKSILAEFTRYYDNLSYTDCLETKSLGAEFAQGIHVFPGLSDDETHHSKLVHHTLRDQLQCYTGSVKVLAARQFCCNIGESVQNCKQYSDGHMGFKDSSNAANSNGNDSQSGMLVTDWPEELNLPLQNTLPDIWTIAEKPQNKNMSSDSAFKNVSKCLPLVQSSDPALCLDYLPYLRDICRSEDGRRLAKTQRRFHHYLNSIGFSLKESTIASLTSTYVIVPNGKQQDS